MTISTGVQTNNCNRQSLRPIVMVEAQGPHSRILMTGGGGGGGPKDFFGSNILAKRDFFGSMKDAGIFLGRENNTTIVLGIVFFSSAQINNYISAIYCLFAITGHF